MANVTTRVDLVINRLSQQKYDQLKAAGQLDPNQLYVTSGGADAVLETRTVAGKALSADVTAADISSAIGLGGYSLTGHVHGNYVPTSRTINGKALTGNVTITGADIAVSTSDSTKIDSALSGKRDYDDLSYTAALTDYPKNTFVVSNANVPDIDGEYTYTTQEQAQVPGDGWYKGGSPGGLWFILQGSTITVCGPSYVDLDTSLAEQDVTMPIGDPSAPSGYLTFHLLRRVPNDSLALDSEKADLSHAHGNITSAGALTADITIANGDKLVVTDASGSSKVARASIAFDGSTTNQYLSKKGTWQTFPTASTSQAGIVQLNNTLTSTATNQAATANAVKLTNDKFSSYLPLSGGNMTGALSVHYGDAKTNIAPYVIIDAYEKNSSNGATGAAHVDIIGDIDAGPYLSLTRYSDDGSVYEQVDIEPAGIFTNTSQDWYWPYIGSLSSQDGERNIANNYDIRQYCAFKSELGYALSVATGVLSSGSYVYKVADRTMTTIGINQSTTPVVVQLPPAGQGARDFILRVEISSSAAPTFTFTNTAGLDFESEDDDWAVMQPGVNLISFTETKR